MEYGRTSDKLLAEAMITLKVVTLLSYMQTNLSVNFVRRKRLYVEACDWNKDVVC